MAPRSLFQGATGADVSDAQTRLKKLGFYKGPISGVYSADTAMAAVALQKQEKLSPVNGGFYQACWDALARLESKGAPSSGPSAPGGATGPSAGTTAPPTSGGGKTQPASGGGTSAGPAAGPPRRSLFQGATGADVSEVQQRLHKLGFYQGSISGVYSSETAAAAVALQKQEKLSPVNGGFYQACWDALARLEAAGPSGPPSNPGTTPSATTTASPRTTPGPTTTASPGPTRPAGGTSPGRHYIPPRPAGALGGQAFFNNLGTAEGKEREDKLYAELVAGNLPSFLRALVPVDLAANGHTGKVWVLPDVLAVGSDSDFVRTPLIPDTAQKLADVFGCSLITKKLSDEIWNAATVKLAPISQSVWYPHQPDHNMQTNAFYLKHNQLIEQARNGRSGLISGIKKDVILSIKLNAPPQAGQLGSGAVVIYGWHCLPGQTYTDAFGTRTYIQSESDWHEKTYVDYSHGIRFISQVMEVDGQPANVSEVLLNKDLKPLLLAPLDVLDYKSPPPPRYPGVAKQNPNAPGGAPGTSLPSVALFRGQPESGPAQHDTSIEVELGQKVTLSWKVSDADQVKLSGGEFGDNPKPVSAGSGGAGSVSALPTSAAQTYTLIALSSGQASRPTTVFVGTHPKGGTVSPHNVVGPDGAVQDPTPGSTKAMLSVYNSARLELARGVAQAGPPPAVWAVNNHGPIVDEYEAAYDAGTLDPEWCGIFAGYNYKQAGFDWEGKTEASAPFGGGTKRTIFMSTDRLLYYWRGGGGYQGTGNYIEFPLANGNTTSDDCIAWMQQKLAPFGWLKTGDILLVTTFFGNQYHRNAHVATVASFDPSTYILVTYEGNYGNRGAAVAWDLSQPGYQGLHRINYAGRFVDADFVNTAAVSPDAATDDPILENSQVISGRGILPPPNVGPGTHPGTGPGTGPGPNPGDNPPGTTGLGSGAPPPDPSVPSIVSFQGTSKGRGELLPGQDGTWRKLGTSGMTKYLSEGRTFTPRKPVTLSWSITNAANVLVDLDLQPNGIGELAAIPNKEKQRDYLTRITREGNGAASIDWLHERSTGPGLFVDLNLYDAKSPDKPIATWVVGGYPRLPPARIDNFTATAPGQGQTAAPGASISLAWQLSDTSPQNSLWVNFLDQSGNPIDRLMVKSHADHTLSGAQDFVLDPSKYTDGMQVQISASLLEYADPNNPSDPGDWDADGSTVSKSGTIGIAIADGTTPATSPPFFYTNIPGGIQNMWSAQDWKPSDLTGLTGTQANNVVNQTYAHLNNQLLNYMGGPPYVANWYTFGKWASREAGQGIRNLSAGASAMQELLPESADEALILALGVVGAATYVARRTQQFSALEKVITDDSGGMFEQVMHLFFGTLNIPYPVLSDLVSTEWQANFVLQLVLHKGAVGDIFSQMVTLLRALIHGNQGIYRNMAWATEVFLQGEAAGGQGLAQLASWCADGAADGNDLSRRDPQLFLQKSFAMYQQCRQLWIQSLTDSENADSLLAKRRNLAHTANVTIGCQEQMLILQSPEVFSHPIVQKIVSRQEGAMRLHDPAGSPNRTIHLLPVGNWADFMQRMGVVPGNGPIQVNVSNPYPVPPGAVFLTPAAATDYVPGGSLAGTIYEYFFDNVDDGAGGSSKTSLMTTNMDGIWDNIDLYPPRPGRYI